MRTISLWEPWGSAIAYQLKRNETRSWSTDFRGELAIHCAKTKKCADFIYTDFAKYFEPVEIFRKSQLSFGKVVAVCRLVEVVTSESMIESGELTEQEKAFGDYSPGRFIWRLEDIVRLPEPIEWKGKQGFFDVPKSALGL